MPPDSPVRSTQHKKTGLYFRQTGHISQLYVLFTGRRPSGEGQKVQHDQVDKWQQHQQ